MQNSFFSLSNTSRKLTHTNIKHKTYLVLWKAITMKIFLYELLIKASPFLHQSLGGGKPQTKPITKIVINFYSQDKAFRATKKLKSWNPELYLFSQHGTLSWRENSEKGTNFQSCKIMWADMNCNTFASYMKSCRWIIDSLVLPWAAFLESFNYRIKMKIVNFNQKRYSWEWIYIFLAILTVRSSKMKKGSSKLMPCQMHNYSKEKKHVQVYMCIFG